MDRLRRDAWWISVQVIATALVLLFIGPFASRADLLRMAEDKAASPWQQLHAGSQERRIAVVLLDDADLAAFGGGWPIDYRIWARLLSRLGCAQPRAVFFDVMFGDRSQFVRTGPEGEPSFAQVDERLRTASLGDTECPGRTGTPLAVPAFYAYADRPEQWLAGVISDERKLPIQWQGSGGDYPLMIEEGSRASRPSVALHLYRIACGQADGASPGCASPPDADDIAQRLVPRWSMRAPAGHDDWSEQRCPDVSPSGALQAAGRWLSTLFGGLEPTPCLPFLTFSAQQVLQGDAAVSAALQGRLVLVGVSITGARDPTPTVTHGQVPGVYLHAMALENLLSFGKDFDRVDRDAVYALTWALIVGSALAHRYVLGGRLRRSGRSGLLIDFFLLPMLCCLVAALLRGVLHLPPGMVAQAALTMSLGLLLGELSQEGRWYERLKHLQPDLSASR